MRKRLFVTICIVCVVLVVCVLGRITLIDYFHAQKLVQAIKNEDLCAMEDLIAANPECINTYPSITPKGWHSAMNWRIHYPLNEACNTGNIALVERLIEKGADVNCNDGYTPLSVVYSFKVDNWYDISLMLIKSGSSLDYITEFSGGYISILEDIVQKRPGDYASDCVPDRDEEVYNSFVYALENCNHSKVDWMSVLQQSVSNDRVEIVKLLLEQGYCDVNDTSVGMTALMFAARDSSSEMVQFLLDYGADKTIKSVDGKTAYDYAVLSGEEGVLELLQ